MAIRPTGKRILVERTKAATVRNGIILPETDAKLNEGMIVATGFQVKELNSGDYVIFNPYAGTDYKDDLLLLSEDDVFCVVTND